MRDVPPGMTALAAACRRAVAEVASRKLLRPATVEPRSVSIATSLVVGPSYAREGAPAVSVGLLALLEIGVELVDLLARRLALAGLAAGRLAGRANHLRAADGRPGHRGLL